VASVGAEPTAVDDVTVGVGSAFLPQAPSASEPTKVKPASEKIDAARERERGLGRRERGSEKAGIGRRRPV
jgi:hypothetical protein